MAALLCTATILTPVSQVLADNDGKAVKKSNYVIKDLDAANSELEQLAQDKVISALVYLKDVYVIRSEADAYSDRVGAVASGQLVYITGVGADSGRNIWYRVRYDSDNVSFTGYVEREFLACSDERLRQWEEKYITTIKREATASVTDCADIEAFPESYKDALYELKASHPEWIFVKMETGLDFAACVASEGTGAYSLIWTKSCLSSWIEAKYDNNWSYATDGIIAYYMDPRNFLTEQQIFQFEQQTYNAEFHTASSVQKVLNGTFMSGVIEGTDTTYADFFMNMASKYNVSPILQAARVKQEQGNAGTSPLISGTYPGFEGLYNYYNIGAASSDPIRLGLEHAFRKQWTSRMASLEGGASFLCSDYISAGQDTLYLQKFDVDASHNGVLTHQYMQNIVAPYNEAASAYKGYLATGLLNDTPYVFRIPVYQNMPSGKSMKPDTPDVLSVNMNYIENLPVDQNAVLIPYINGGLCEAYDYRFSSSNSSVVKVDENGVITGIRPGDAFITCYAEGAGAANCAVSVIKADIALGDVEKPVIELTYDPGKTLDSVELPEAFSWADGSIVPAVENNGYTAVYSPDDSRYNSLSMVLDVKVNKARVAAEDISLPTDLTAVAGSELGTVALPNHFKWASAMDKVSAKAGEFTYLAVYCPDEANYEPTTDLNVTVSVVCNEHNYGEWGEPSNGVRKRVCQICGHEDSENVEIKASEGDCAELGHNMVNGVCSRCGYTSLPTEENVSATPETTPEATPETTPEATPETTPETTPEATPETTPESTPESTPETTPEVTPEATASATPEATVSVTPKVTEAVVTNEAPAATASVTNEPKVTPTPIPTTVKAEPTATASVTNGIKATPTPDTVTKDVTGTTPSTTPKTDAESGSGNTALTTPSAGQTDISPSATEPVSAGSTEETGTASLGTPVLPQVTRIPATSSEQVAPVSSVRDSASDITQPDDYVSTQNVSEDADAGAGDVNVSSGSGDEYKTNEPSEVILPAGDGASWKVSKDAADTIASDDMDMTVTLGQADIPDYIVDKAGKDDYILMSIAYEGEFGFGAVLTVDTGTDHAGRYANLNYYNKETGKLVLVDSALVGGDGAASFDMTHASDYIITFSDKQQMARTATNMMLYVIIAIIIAGGLGVLGYVLYRVKYENEDEDEYYD